MTLLLKTFSGYFLREKDSSPYILATRVFLLLLQRATGSLHSLYKPPRLPLLPLPD